MQRSMSCRSRGAAVALALVAACGGPSSSPTVPPAPMSVRAVGGDGQITLTWSAVPGATAYDVYWSTAAGVTRSTGTKIAAVSSGYVHAGRTNGTPYYYVVTAVNAVGESAESAQVTATPRVPGNRSLRISWDANREKGVNSPGGGYRVSTDGGVHFQDVPYLSGAVAPTYLDTVLFTGAYAAEVRAYQAIDATGGTAGSQSAPTRLTLQVP